MAINFDWFESVLLILFILACLCIYFFTRSRVLQMQNDDPAKTRKNAIIELWTGINWPS